MTTHWSGVPGRHHLDHENVIDRRKHEILGVGIDCFTRDEAIAYIDRCLKSGHLLCVCFANAHTLNMASTTTQVREALRRFLVLNDGIGIDIASKLKYGIAFPDNLNGTDFVPAFLARTQHRLRLYLVGSTDAVAEQAANSFQHRFPRHRIIGWRNGFFRNPNEIHRTCRDIRAAQADCVLVGMGNPLQELWIANHAMETGARLLIGVGALFDFEAGRVVRAPRWVRNIRCEWAYRLLLEPNRLARRYLIGNVAFLSKAVVDSWNHRRG